MSSPVCDATTEEIELTAETAIGIAKLRHVVKTLQPLLVEFRARLSALSYHERFITACGSTVTQLLAEHKTHTEELRLINQDINHLEDLVKTVRNINHGQTAELHRRVGEFRAEIREINRLLTNTGIEDTNTILLDESEMFELPDCLTEPTDQSVVDPSVQWAQLMGGGNSPLLSRLNFMSQQTTGGSSGGIGQDPAAKLKNCHSCQRQIHRNAPTCPFCKTRSGSKNPKRLKKRVGN